MRLVNVVAKIAEKYGPTNPAQKNAAIAEHGVIGRIYGHFAKQTDLPNR